MDIKRKPKWLRVKMNDVHKDRYVRNILEKLSLNTVCEEANCPNKIECFSKKTATFMILGSQCSRNCRFCNVSSEKLEKVDEKEPKNVAQATMELGLKHVVITSVTRDDLPDGGAKHFAKVIESIRSKDKDIAIEVLIPDFKGDKKALKYVVEAKPDIINHNIETVPRLYDDVRPQAIYKRSLQLLEEIKKLDSEIYTKSGIMVGLGEREEEIAQTMADLREYKCDFLTVGQYLPPSNEHYPIQEYVTPETFKRYKDEALKLGFSFVASEPLVRSSYKASDMLAKAE
ncbi:lipoyl synthase [Proteinivorax hydrogeniformans]|uniref:Lipoyl synthase n=1 Tax=Proteinivorax hydrogeniformans TaxID=1826727 RepID=A0AAU8HT12_9FIRM